MQGLGVEVDRQVGVDGRQLQRHPRLLLVGEEPFAVGLPGHLARAFQEARERAVLLDQPLRPLLADPRDARDVVDRVPHEGENVGDLLGRDPEVLLDLSGAVELAPPGVVHGDVGTHELHEILVGRDQDHVVAGVGRLLCQGAEDVVGLVAVELQDGDTMGGERPAHPGDLAPQVVRHGIAVGLVLLVPFGPHALLGAPSFEGDPDEVGLLLAEELA